MYKFKVGNKVKIKRPEKEYKWEKQIGIIILINDIHNIIVEFPKPILTNVLINNYYKPRAIYSMNDLIKIELKNTKSKYHQVFNI